MLALFFSGFVVFLFSCTKLNQPTELGGELLPAVDNINTFDTLLDVSAAYHPFDDSSRNLIGDNMALGQLHDPEFGNTTADMYFNLSSPAYGTSPFFHPDSLVGIDSVVLSLAYVGAYGDTSMASQFNVSVSEILPGDSFNDTTLYRFDRESFPTGITFGSKTFTLRQLRDSITLIRKSDTARVTNVLRIRLDNVLGNRLAKFDTTNAYKTDSAFRARFRGLAVKTDNVTGAGALGYFSLMNPNSGLTVYFRVKKSGANPDTASATFIHSRYSQANSILRTPGGSYLAGLNTFNPQKLFIQSSPDGSYAGMFIAGLSGLPNKIIHRAELVAFKVPSASDNLFAPPARLLLDRKGPTDSAYLFDSDVQIGTTGSVDLGLFGGNLQSGNSYRFNITRYVQGIVTRKERNDSLRIYAPLRSILYAPSLRTELPVENLVNIASGRVVLAGPTYADPALRPRLRIIYSNL